MSSTLSPTQSLRHKRKRAGSQLPLHHSKEAHDTALATIRTFLKCHTCYDAFPVSFRLIVLDTKLNVKKALQCLLLNGEHSSIEISLFFILILRCRLCASVEQ